MNSEQHKVDVAIKIADSSDKRTTVWPDARFATIECDVCHKTTRDAVRFSMKLGEEEFFVCNMCYDCARERGWLVSEAEEIAHAVDELKHGMSEFIKKVRGEHE